MYLLGDSLPETRAAAAAAFQRACAGVSAASTPDSSFPGALAIAAQLRAQGPDVSPNPVACALLRPAAWPAAVLAGDLARDSPLASLALEAAVLEFCFGQALAAQLAAVRRQGGAQLQKSNSRPYPDMGMLPAQLLAVLPAQDLAQQLMDRREFCETLGGDTNELGIGLEFDEQTPAASGAGASGLGEVERWLRLGWAALACLAERATPADSPRRLQWVVAFAAQLQARFYKMGVIACIWLIQKRCIWGLLQSNEAFACLLCAYV